MKLNSGHVFDRVPEHEFVSYFTVIMLLYNYITTKTTRFLWNETVIPDSTLSRIHKYKLYDATWKKSLAMMNLLFISYVALGLFLACLHNKNWIGVQPLIFLTSFWSRGILLLESLDTKKSFGIDKAHPLLLRIAALQIYRPLTYIFNLSINQGIFPDSRKLAKVLPVFKQGSRFTCNNYRPI